MKYFESSFESTDGEKIFICEWKPDKDLKGIICLVHGLGEHIGRYSHVAEIFNSYGYALIGLDIRGHGRSPGKRGHIEDYDLIMDDIEALIDEAIEKYPGRPCYLYGHSMGGNLVINYALRREAKVKGVIATSPWLRLTKPPSPRMIKLIEILNYICPSFTQENGLKSTDLCKDKESTKKYDKDPLVHSRISARLFTTVHRAGIWSINNANRISTPLLILHGKADKITSYEASEELVAKASQYSSIKLWDGLYHELHNESRRNEIYEYIFDWIDKSKKNK